MEEQNFHGYSIIDNEQQMAREIVDQNLTSLLEVIEVDYQLEHSDKRNLKKHNKLYTKLLKQYVINFENISNIKKVYKKGIIDILLLMMIGIPTAVIALLYYIMENFYGQEDLPILISGTLTGIVSLISAFVVIPKIIISYLFNAKEEENMTAIIKNIQDYDKQIRMNSNLQNEEQDDKNVS